jgi:apolipoprotein N-acyltransferase
MNISFFTRSPRHCLGTALLCGILAGLAFAPVFFLPGAFIGLSGLVALASGASFPRQGFGWGWLFGMGYFTTGLYWIAFSMHVNWAVFGWLFPLAMLGLPAFFALFPAVALAVAIKIGRLPWQRAFLFILFFSLLETLRGVLWTGFPWLSIADIWFVSDAMAQNFAVGGPALLGLVTLICITSIPGYRRLHALFSVFILTLMAVYGISRLASASFSFHPHITLKLIQANIPQKLKWEPSLRHQHVDKHLGLIASHRPPPSHQVITICAESALPFYAPGSHLVREVSKVLSPQEVLLMGSVRLPHDTCAYNTLVAIFPGGESLPLYDKCHLVPFGEYLPGRPYWPSFVHKLTPGNQDFISGSHRPVPALPDIPSLAAFICYEIIFSGEVRQAVLAQTPQWLLTVTNDGWYLNTSGPYQHFHMSRARAIETGRPVIRVANTGISGVIDPYGRVLQTLPYGRSGVISSALPKALPYETLYLKLGNKIYWFCITFFILLYGILSFIRRRQI